MVVKDKWGKEKKTKQTNATGPVRTFINRMQKTE
jgi:hypothetical protein